MTVGKGFEGEREFVFVKRYSL